MQTTVQDRPERGVRREVALLLEQIVSLTDSADTQLMNYEQVSINFSDPDFRLPSAANCEQSHVLLDMEWQGVRYTLVRTLLLGTDLVAFDLEEGERIHLSPREQEIVRLVAKGYPNKIIAGILDISQWTVSTHLRRIFAKLSVSSRAEMVASAMTWGLVSGEK